MSEQEEPYEAAIRLYRLARLGSEEAEDTSSGAMPMVRSVCHLGPQEIEEEEVNDKSIRELQSSLPWTSHYHHDFRSNPQAHKDFAHALLHIHKAGGNLATIIDKAEHAGYNWADPALRADVEKYVADMVICALRMANTCPDGVIDLQRAVEARLTAKNNQVAPVIQGHETMTLP